MAYDLHNDVQLCMRAFNAHNVKSCSAETLDANTVSYGFGVLC